jgi:hypothetical protein
MERPTPKPSKEQMARLIAAADEERMRTMPLPESKPSADEIAAMKEAGRQEFRDNRQRVINHLKKRGLSNAAIAGIVGNIDVETGGSFDYQQRQTRTGDPRSPDIKEGGGYGLFQFDDPGRKAGHETWYKQYLEQTGKEDSTESQLDYFLDMVISGSDTQSPFRKYAENLGATNASTLKAYLQTSTSPIDIADAITDRFEFPGKSHSDRRRSSATDTFSELQPVIPEALQGAAMDTGTTSGPKNIEQYIDQPGTIEDTGEGPDMDTRSTYEKVKPYIPILRHFNEGGMALEKQMELFEDGGLKDEGGTTDPISGNDVPPGSTQEEVRDDIPAQLSEGEFVFPADVVRYIGLEKLMQMRQEAKMGLQTMEDMGQMGNSDQAIMPDDIPFDLSDLDMDDDLEYNVGGFVPGVQQQQNFTGISNYRPPQMPQGVGGYTPAPMPSYPTTQAPGAYVPPQQAAVPMAPPPMQMPEFGKFTEQNIESREYINSETGEKRVFTFINGQPTVPIPPGFVPSSEYVKPETAKPVTEQVTTQTTRVTEEDPTEPPDPEKMQRMKDRIQAARDLGYLGKDQPTTAGFLSGLTGSGEAGQVTGVGYILDGKGNLFDPLNGQMVPKTIVGAISREIDEFRLSQSARDKLRLAEAQKTEFGKDLFDRMVNKGIDNRFNEFLERANEETDPSDRKAAREYTLNVKAEVERQAEIGNVGTDGRIINPAETARGRVPVPPDPSRGEGSMDAARDFARRQRDDQGPALTTGTAPQDFSSPDPRPTNQYDFPTERSTREDRFGEAGKYMKDGGLAAKKKPKAKKMKRGGLASKK